ncbi:sulfite oxidase-like oxidoreductase [Acidiphilium sp.]|uniref:sulfite oxidase-like oxidoreductase n=1 Tax=Acidiphilium sp. TaxID=527 RepID=UPI00258B03B9|nr:sulfite oxidase-like oxidoreductase [Acidiphilium sp.]
MDEADKRDDDGPEISLIGQIRDKLIGRKQDWSREGRGLTGATAPPAQRLPPGQRLVTDWPVLDLGVQPEVPKAAFRLAIDGAVANPVTLDWDGFMALPQQDSVSDMHCVTTWSRYDNHWRGVSIRTILDLVRPHPEATHVLFESYDDYTTNLRLDQFAAEDCYLVHSWEGKPLTRQHGGPVRVLVPRYYLWKSAKWVRRITFATADRKGFWETRGYNNNADPWAEERYA